jgi:hypothetical protein
VWALSLIEPVAHKARSARHRRTGCRHQGEAGAPFQAAANQDNSADSKMRFKTISAHHGPLAGGKKTNSTARMLKHNRPAAMELPSDD